MMRRDYILRMIDEFFRLLARVKTQKEQGEWREAEGTLEEEARRLTGADLEALSSLSDTEILARLLRTGEIHSQREKAFMLARVLIEAAEVAEADSKGAEQAQTFRLKALHLLLQTALRSEGAEWPQFVPPIDVLAETLKEALPVQTNALLMQHFERSGQFAKAEDSFYAALEQFPESPGLRQLGISFYQRLLAISDVALETGNLPRAEVEAGLDQLRQRE
jgi:hypothetical protein